MAKGPKRRGGGGSRQRGGTPGSRGGGPQQRRAGGPQQLGGAPNMNQMMAQVQRLQQDMETAQEQLRHETVTGSAGGGMVTVQVTGDLRVTGVTIDPEAVDPEDAGMLADMVMAAVNEAVRSAQELAASRLGEAGGGLDLGGLGGLGGPGGLGLPGLQP